MLKKSPFNSLKKSYLKKVPFKKKKKTAEEFHEKVVAIEKMRSFFLSVWKKRSIHICVVCGKGLGSEPLSYMFHHVVAKQRQKDYSIDITYDEKNIVLVDLDCHNVIENGRLTPFLKTLKDELEEYYEHYRI
jgi:hypothetical protein